VTFIVFNVFQVIFLVFLLFQLIIDYVPRVLLMSGTFKNDFIGKNTKYETASLVWLYKASKIKIHRKKQKEVGTVVHSYNPSSWKAEAGESEVQRLPDLHSETLTRNSINKTAQHKQPRRIYSYVNNSCLSLMGLLEICFFFLYFSIIFIRDILSLDKEIIFIGVKIT
jgi:hypothetical protein